MLKHAVMFNSKILLVNMDLADAYLDKQPRRNQSQTTVLTIKPIVISIEEKVVEVEES